MDTPERERERESELGEQAFVQACERVAGDAIFRFYILFLLGFMSGLAAGQGSRFMNAKNADATIGGIRVLQKLMTVNATDPR